MSVIKFRHYSEVLSTPMECNIVMPDVTGNDKLKVVWLCHGGSGHENDWLYHVDLCSLANEYNLAFVTVNAQDSCFVDMAYGLNYGTYLAKELPEIIFKTFRQLSSAREDNYISGLSNGGYGCFYLGLLYPENYAAIGAFSAGDKADATPKPFAPGQMNPRIRMFGQENIHDTNYSIKHLARTLAKTDRPKPRIYHACGGKDPWLDLNLLMKECVETINTEADTPVYSYEYHQIDEFGHEWAFWSIELTNFLQKCVCN